MHERVSKAELCGHSAEGSRCLVIPHSSEDEQDFGANLFAASTIGKSDDVEELHSWLSQPTNLRVLDICGGYGRFRLHWPSSVRTWVVVDRSEAFARIGAAIAGANRISPIEFVQGDVLKGVGLPGGAFDLGVCAHNSLNELPDLRPAFDLFANCLTSNGHLFIKVLWLHPSDVPVAPWPADQFQFGGEFWTSSISGLCSGWEQTLHTTYEGLSSGRRWRTTTMRWIWPLALIDEIAATRGFRRIHTGHQRGTRLYQKQS